MVPLDYVLAVAVLVASPHCGAQAPDLTGHACLAPSLSNVALSWELIDPREEGLLFARSSDFPCDVELVQRRYAELVDAPPVCDALRLPNKDRAGELLTFNRTYYATLKQRHELLGDTVGAVVPAMAETDRLYRIWDLVRDAGSDCYYVSVRRQALLTLRQAIGVADFAAAKLPPHVPVWRFSHTE